MALLEKEPPSFYCEYDDENGNQTWRECTKEEICSQNLPKDRYKPNENEDEYIDNWVEQYDLLCEPKWKIGLLGSCFFVGVITTMIVASWLADEYGRKWVTLTGWYIYMLCALGLIFSTDIYYAYVLLFIAGTTFASRILV